MKKSAETFSIVCDALVSESSSLTAAASAAMISTASLFRWLAASAEGDPEFIFEWGDYGTAPFHVHVKNASRLAAIVLQGEAMKLATKGFKRLQIVGGHVMYQERLDIPPGMSPDEMELCFGVRDRYERTPEGNLIPLYADEAPNPLLITQVLKAMGPPQWSKDERKTLQVNHSGGVTVVGNQQSPQVPRLAHTIVKAAAEMAQEMAEEPELTTIPQQSFETLPNDFEPDTEDEGQPVLNAEPPAPPAKEPEPVEYVSAVKEGEKPVPVNPPPTLTEAQRASVERLKALAMIKPKNPNPKSAVQIFPATDG